MGKAARAKSRQQRAQEPEEPDYGARLTAGLCLHCGKRAPRQGALWCNPCIDSAKAAAARKQPPQD